MMKEPLGYIAAILWIIAGIQFMNWFGFQDHLHDVLWSLGAAIAVMIIFLGAVYIFLRIAKDEPWLWPTKSDKE